MNIFEEIFQTAQDCIDTSDKDMVSSAQVALDDAKALYERSEYTYIVDRVLDSLAYSVGVFHTDYQRILNLDLTGE